MKVGKPEKDAFVFQSVDGVACHAMFAVDVQPLFSEPNVWYTGAIACASCHGENVAISADRMSLTSYASILAGARCKDQNSPGTNILDDGKGNWNKSSLVTAQLSVIG